MLLMCTPHSLWRTAVAGTTATHGVGTEGAQPDTVCTFNCFHQAHHLKLPPQARKLVQYVAGTPKRQCLSLLWLLYRWKKVTFLECDQTGSHSCLHITMQDITWAQKLRATNSSNFAEHQEGQLHELKSLRDQSIVTENGNMKQVNCMSGSRHYLWRILDDFHPQQMHKSSKVKVLENC